MRRILIAPFLPLVAFSAEEPPTRITPIFTKEAIGAPVVVTAVPGVRAASKSTGGDASFAISIRGAVVTFNDIHPLTAKMLQAAAAKKMPLNFTVQTYRSEGGWPSGRIHAEPKFIEKKRPSVKDGMITINPWEKSTYETPAIVRITKGDETIYDIDACEIHWEPLHVRAIPVSYGLMMRNMKAPLPAVISAKFPHSKIWRSGGCCIDPGSPSHVEEYVCDACLKTRKAWEAKPVPGESLADELEKSKSTPKPKR